MKHNLYEQTHFLLRMKFVGFENNVYKVRIFSVQDLNFWEAFFCLLPDETDVSFWMVNIQFFRLQGVNKT